MAAPVDRADALETLFRQALAGTEAGAAAAGRAPLLEHPGLAPERPRSPVPWPKPGVLRDQIERRYGLPLTAWRRLGGGDECRVWRTTGPEGDVVVRVSPATRSSEELAWTHALSRFAASAVPEVVAPLRAADGTTLFACAAGVVALFPFVPGRAADRRRPAERLAAAAVLARLHSRMRLWDSPAPPPVSGRRHPTAPAGPVAGEPETLTDPLLDAWHSARATAGDLLSGPVHGDFYRRNLRWRAGRVAGVIDWDDAHVGFLMQEAAWAAWEFAKTPAGDDLDWDGARAFLDAYRSAGGPSPLREYRTIPMFIRWRLRGEIRGNLAAAGRGEAWDPAYVGAELRAFARLRCAVWSV